MKAFSAIAFAALLLIPMGCIVEDITRESGRFICSSSDDCRQGFTCENGQCITAGQEPDCVDEDNDGYGVGDTSSCDTCINTPGICTEDCDDSDPDKNPAAAEICDGKDNDCDPDTADGQIPCDPSEPGTNECPSSRSDTIGECPEGSDVCMYYPALRFGAECNQPLECVNGEREPVPDACK